MNQLAQNLYDGSSKAEKEHQKEKIKNLSLIEVFDVQCEIGNLFVQEVMKQAPINRAIEEFEARALEGPAVKFNASLNFLYTHLSEIEKNIIATVGFDYLHRKMACEIYQNQDCTTSYPSTRELLAYEHYKKLAEQRLTEMASFTQIKIFLIKCLIGAYEREIKDLMNLNFSMHPDLDGSGLSKEAGYKRCAADGMSRTYALNLSKYQLMPMQDAQAEKSIGVYSFYVDTGAYIFEGKVQMPSNPYNIKDEVSLQNIERVRAGFKKTGCN